MLQVGRLLSDLLSHFCSCDVPQCLHLPDLFSDFDILFPFCCFFVIGFVCVRTYQILHVCGGVDKTCLFPKKLIVFCVALH